MLRSVTIGYSVCRACVRHFLLMFALSQLVPCNSNTPLDLITVVSQLHPCNCNTPQDLITEMIKANPSFKPPADYKPEKKYRRLRIPLEEYPGYNFIGLIIGPRGNTQKRMERVS